MKTKEQKLLEIIENITNLLTDQNIADLENDGALEGEKETFGAMVFATSQFNRAYKLLQRARKIV